MTEFSDKHLYIVRHGETEYNRLNIVQGSGVDTELNERGIVQSIRFFNHYKDHPFDKVYTSALTRSKQSVQRFIEKGIPHESLPELNEISWGILEGKRQTHEQKQLYWEVVKKWNDGEVHEKVPDGESPFEMQTRQQKAIDHMLKKKHEKNVLICMHGRAMKSFLCLLLNQPLSKMEEFQHSNLCLYLLKYDGLKFELISANNTRHLQ